jgi:hypothetical protein
MANPNPWQARLAKALRQRPGDLDDTRRRTWGILCLAYDEVGTVEDADARRKALLAYMQVVSVYAKLWEAGEFEARLAASEESVRALISAARPTGEAHQ